MSRMDCYIASDNALVADTLNELGLVSTSFLVTGATGLVGSCFCKSILEANTSRGFKNKVIAVARNIGKVEIVFSDYLDDPFLKLVHCDDMCRFDLDMIPEYVLHAAGNTDSAYMVSHPVETFRGIIGGTESILDYFLEKDLKKIVFLSSMEVYGYYPERTVVKEDSQLGDVDLYDARSCYPVAKRATENLLLSYNKEYGMPAVSLRLAQTFGLKTLPGDKRFLSMLVDKARNREDIVLATKGDKINNFCYLADAVTAILFSMVKGDSGSVYNVSDMSSVYTIKEIADIVAHDIMKDQIKTIIEASLDNSKKYAKTTYFVMDSSKLLSLGWKPTVSLRETLIRNICS